MVPLAWDYTVLDLARACELDAIVVARAGLGTLNHVAMTVTVLRAREIAVRGVVLNGRSATPDLAESTNPDALARMLPGIPLVETPHWTSGSPVTAAAALVDRLLDLERVPKGLRVPFRVIPDLRHETRKARRHSAIRIATCQGMQSGTECAETAHGPIALIS